jgi:hypothetical protein
MFDCPPVRISAEKGGACVGNEVWAHRARDSRSMPAGSELGEVIGVT